jgi:group II intron reverse transcriptase/maturase
MGELLEQVLTPDNLREAWNEVAENRGMPGVDNVSIRRWRRNWEERLINLARDVRANHYKPAKLRVRRIPKKRRDQYRTLRIPTVTDRVLQRAVLQVLYAIYEPRFLPCSYGYRPGRSLKDAVQAIVDFREQGYTWVLDADIDAYFDSVDQRLLLEQLRRQVDDAALLRLIDQWLERARPAPDISKGLPMGGPLSPLLANVHLHPLDQRLLAAGWKVVRYADDFIVLARDQEDVQAAYIATEQMLADLKLRYEPTKTRIVNFEQGFEFLGVTFEDDEYSYPWEDKRIVVEGNQADWLFNAYGPDY